MKIALYSLEYPDNGFPFGGVGAYTYGIAHALSKNHEVTVLTYGSGPEFMDKNVKITPLGGFKQQYIPMLEHLKYSVLLNNHLKKNHYDVLEVPHNCYPGLFPSLFSSTPIVVKLHGEMPAKFLKEFGEYNFFNYQLLKLNIIPYKKADIVTSPTQLIADIAIKEWGNRDIKIVPNGNNFNLFRKNNITKKELLGVNDDTPVILHVGRGHIKGTDLVLKAAKYFLKEYNDALFVFVGPDTKFGKTTMHSWIKKSAKEIGIYKNVKIIGFLNWNDLIKYYSVADLTCFPSRVDNFPNVVLESLACGTPVVGTRETGIAEMIDDSCGRLTSRDPLDIADAILELISIGKTNLEIGIQKRINRYSWDKIAKMTLEVYESI